MINRILIWSVGLIVVLGGGEFSLQHSTAQCETAAIRSTDVSEDGWRLITQGFDCGFGVDGGVNIVASNRKLGKPVVVAVGDDVGETLIKVEPPNSFLISLPNLSDIQIKPVSISGLTIKYIFSLRYNPDERGHYQAWLKNAANAVNRRWYCTTIMPTINPSSRDVINENLAYTYLMPHGSKKSYCS